MKKIFSVSTISLFIMAATMALLITGCKPKKFVDGEHRDRNFNAAWKFIKDSLPEDPNGLTQPELPEFDDAQWTTLDLPHDWSNAPLPGESTKEKIGPFSLSSPGATATGYVTGGTAWYRKHFKLDKTDAGKIITLRFDGVYMETEVWVNGKIAGNHVYGYTPFYFDITSLLNKAGDDNVIAVKVSNTGRNSRWYSGSGIYRNVILTVTEPVHVPVWGVCVTTSEITDSAATTNLKISIRNSTAKSLNAMVKIRIMAPGNLEAGMATKEVNLPAEDEIIVDKEMMIHNPVRWSPSSPGLYEAIISLEINGKITDQYSQNFGIRSLEVSAEKGFILNGKALELKGGCMHHDNGLLGSAAFERAEERRVQLMKANGFNAIRTSHNPPSEAFLNACDRLGMMVIDETFDMWERPKNPQDYHRFFREWWRKDLKDMIMRDRNHPCVIMWSIGNEINERADTSGLRIAKSLISFINQLDSSRPFTNAICEFWDIPGAPWEKNDSAFQLLTVGGYNYQYLRYESDHGKFPQRIMMGTESVPKDAFENWQQVEKHPYVIGDFVWTAMDYLGETGIGHTQYLTKDQQDAFAMTWPWFNAWCGDIDLMGDKKPQMFYKDVIWGNSKLEMNVHALVPEGKTEKVSYWGWPDEYPHWNWNGNEDKMMQVSVYTPGDAVKLVLNGREIGNKPVSDDTRLTATFEVPFEPGELKAVAYLNEKEFATKIFKTTGQASDIRLTADRNVIRASREDLAFVTIEITDEFGQLVTDAIRPITISVTGNGEMVASGNACPYDMNSVGRTEINTFHGKAMVIVRPFAHSGLISVSVSGGGLKDGAVVVKVE